MRRWRICLVPAVIALAACSVPKPHKVIEGRGEISCDVTSSIADQRCFSLTPEVSENPPYTLHFVEFDDQGWLYPGRESRGYVPEMGSAHRQLDRAVEDVSSRLAKDERVLLLVYVHGWKHGAAYDDRDVIRFRKMLADASVLDEKHRASSVQNGQRRSVVGIYFGWRGAGRLSPNNPLINLTFWTRKNAALHVSEGAPRELFARIRALRAHWNAKAKEERPRLRTLVMGHSFGGWVVFSALSPSLLELLAEPVDVDLGTDAKTDREAWQRARLRSAADMVILVNPAFEATRYQSIHNLAQAAGRKLTAYEPPALLVVTSTADAATGTAFPIGRFFNTLFQHPFVSGGEGYAALRTPGFVDEYVTHTLTSGPVGAVCPGWRIGEVTGPRAEGEAQRIERFQENANLEKQRHKEWNEYLRSNDQSLPQDWTWQYCGGTTISKKMQSSQSVYSPVWNVVTDSAAIRDHSDIMGEPLHAFFRQLYLDLPW